MNQTNILMHIQPDILKVQAAVIESSQRNGIKGFVILDIFNKTLCDDASQFTVQMRKWVDNLYWTVYNNNRSQEYPINEVILNLRGNFWCDMTPQQIANSKCNYKKQHPSDFARAVTYTNRFYPADIDLYESMLTEFLEYMDSKNMLSITTFDLWGEPNSDRYWWGTLGQFLDLTWTKVRCLIKYGCRILAAHTTTSLLIDPTKNKPSYLNWINTTTSFDDWNIGFSTSLYKHCTAGEYDYNNNHFPTRAFSRVVLVECGFSGSGALKRDTANYNYFMSRNMMHYFIDMLKYSVKVGSDTIALFTLCDGSPNDDRGILAYWTHESGNYAPRPVWYVLVDLLSVIKDGWEETATGIRGATKEIVLTTNDYYIKLRL